MALHEQSVDASDEWYTPSHVFDALGCSFDMDVASPGPEFVPWIPAREHVMRESLTTQWRGFVWMNPPFGGRNGLLPWLAKWDSHGDGIALVPDRTSAPWWQIYAGRAQLLLFVAPKLKLFRGAPRPDMADLFGSVPSDGSLEPGASPAQGTTLLGIGEQACAALWNASARGLGLLSKPARRSGD